MKLTGLWWWIDRWRKSTAYTGMTVEEQGAYRNLIDEATLRGGPIPNDENLLARACGDARIWRRVRSAVLARFVLRSDGWHNETLDEVITESQKRAERQRNYRNKQHNEHHNAQHNGHHNNERNSQRNDHCLERHNEPRPPDPDPVVFPERSPEIPPLPPAESRSGRPVFKGQRLVVFEWQLDDCRKVLGKNTNDFALDEWFYDLDASLVNSNLVLPKRDGGKWLQTQLLKEVKRRRLPIAGQEDSEYDDDTPWAWRCGKCGDIHEGTAAQHRSGICLKSSSEFHVKH